MMDLATISRRLAHHSRGTITATEFANALFVDLTSDNGELADLGALVAELPDEVQQEVQRLAHRIRDNQFAWKPFLIGAGADEADPERLRRICTVLDQVPVKAGQSR